MKTLNVDPSNHRFSVTHGEAKKSKEYEAWCKIKGRCFNPNNKSFYNYGGRGVTVCDRWRLSFTNFLEDVGRAPSPKHSIDRIDNSGNYEPGNVRWATDIQQANNKRNNRFVEYKGQVKTIGRWCDELQINRFTIESRLKRNWSITKALETPTRK